MPSTGSRSWRCADRADRCRRGRASGARRGRGRRRLASIARPVERAGARPRRATRPHAGHWQAGSVGAFLEEQQLDATVGRASSVCSQPARRGRCARPPRASARARQSPARPASARGTARRASSSSAGLRAPRRRSSRRRALHLVREQLASNSARVSSEQTTTSRGRRARADVTVELVRDLPQVVLHELLDVALVARLRPAALVVLAGLLLEWSASSSSRPPLQPVEHRRARGRRRRRARPRRGRRAGRAARGRGPADLRRVRTALGQRRAAARGCRARRRRRRGRERRRGRSRARRTRGCARSRPEALLLVVRELDAGRRVGARRLVEAASSSASRRRPGSA